MRRILLTLSVISLTTLAAFTALWQQPPGPASATGVVAVSAGANHTCALTNIGGVRCWGANGAGQLGDDTTTDRTTPVDVWGLTSGVAAVSVGNFHTCAVTTAGGVKCWGLNSSGQLGDGTTEDSALPVDVLGLTSGVTAVTTGSGYTCALTTSGGLKCWGTNYLGQLGDGTTASSSTPVDVSGLTSDVTAVTAGSNHTCALTTSGGLKCWGSNQLGKLGDGTATSSSTPVNVSGLTVGMAAVSAGGSHTCAITTLGDLKCWGANDKGQLGIDSTGESTPVDVSDLTSDVTAVTAGSSHTCAITTAGGLKCWGQNNNGQLGNSTTNDSSTPADVSGLNSNVAAVSAGLKHTCTITSAGSLECWGWKGVGLLGDGTTSRELTPVDVVGLGSDVIAVAAGRNHTCALSSTGGVTCWGANGAGQLGNGTTTDSATPVNVSGLTSGVVAIDAAGNETCTIDSAAVLKCWGANITTPGNIFGLKAGITAVGVGNSHTCAIAPAVGVYCWGSNLAGQLGDGTATDSSIPVVVLNLPSSLLAVSAGGTHTCALTASGGLKCWGLNVGGQLGDGTIIGIRSTPVDVLGLTSGVTAESAGDSHTCAVTSAGGLKCWGLNVSGQLGDGTTALISRTPVDVTGFTSDASAVTAFLFSTCALTTTGGIKCWGENSSGQLGNGTTTDSNTPVDVSGLTSGLTAVDGGRVHACAVTVANGVKCWGSNSAGQLGNGDFGYRTTPALVAGAKPLPTPTPKTPDDDTDGDTIPNSSDTDDDGDGCADIDELQPPSAAITGGGRNPHNFWDFFDVWTGTTPSVRDGAVGGGDIAAVVLHFGFTQQPPPTEAEALAEALTAPVSPTGYHASYDRGGSFGPNPWNLLPPDGSISGGDISAVVLQFGHNCN